MSLHQDQQKVVEAVDLLHKGQQRLDSLLRQSDKMNTEIVEERWSDISSLEEHIQEELQDLNELLKSYVHILIKQGKSYYAPPRSPQRDVAAQGFQVLNEASGLRLGLEVERFKEKMEVLNRLQGLNQEMLQDRMDFLTQVVEAMRQDEKDLVYESQEPHKQHSRGKGSVVFNHTA